VKRRWHPETEQASDVKTRGIKQRREKTRDWWCDKTTVLSMTRLKLQLGGGGGGVVIVIPPIRGGKLDECNGAKGKGPTFNQQSVGRGGLMLRKGGAFQGGRREQN